MIDEIITGLAGGYLSDRLFKLIPPKKNSEFDCIRWEQLRSRNNWIEICGSVIFLGGWVAIPVFYYAGAAAHNEIKDGVVLLRTGWQIGFWLCFPVFLVLLFVAIVTLWQGFTRFREYWRFHELKHRTRLAALLALYIPSAALGVISAFMLFVG
jgi:hypothetical protein